MIEHIAGSRPTGAYSPGVVASGRFVFVSGPGPLREGKPIGGTIEEETRLALENLGAVLAGAGASTSSVVRVGVFLADIADFAPMDTVYREYFGEPRPARTTVGAALPLGIKVEIDCIAALGDEA